MTFISTVGKVRRSQSVFTYGVGAIVDFAKGSFMPLSLQHMEWQWSRLSMEARDAMTIREPRLQKLLNVSEFRTMPVPGDRQISEFGAKVRQEWTIPVYRFPRWLECPRCHRLGTIGRPFEVAPNGSVSCSACKVTDVTPVRFIIACRRGHIEDFPWIFWAHSNAGKICDNPQLFLNSMGKSASLADLFVKCKNCKAHRGLGDIFQKFALAGRECKGKSPWLQLEDNNDCDAELQTLQRGASNVHFPVTASMLSIPPASDAIAKVLERHWDLLSAIPESALSEALGGFIERLGLNVDHDLATDWVRRRKRLEGDQAPATEAKARFQEFQALCKSTPAEPAAGEMPDFENAVFEPPSELHPFVDLIGAVHRLREVRVYCGFNRIDPVPLSIEGIHTAVREGKISKLSATPAGWLPAIDVRGEGIFLRLSDQRLKAWEDVASVKKRADVLHAAYRRQCGTFGFEPPHRITARLLLVHSFAHALIRRLSLDCGYSSASLRERLYLQDDSPDTPSMAGVLIYTASPDSDGSLGGLVSLATPDRISFLVRQAVEDASWCGNDPVCSEADPRTTGERLNGAACHSCMLISETSCEKFNRELDRIMITGGVTDDGERIPGFFQDLLIAT